MAAFQKFDSFVEALAEKKHNLGADVLKFFLTNDTPVAADAVKADITEITAGGGYTAGGNQAMITSSAQAVGVYKLVLADPPTWTGTTGFGPFRYAVLYNDTAANKELIGFFDYGSAISIGAGESFIVDCDPGTGVLTLT